MTLMKLSCTLFTGQDQFNARGSRRHSGQRHIPNDKVIAQLSCCQHRFHKVSNRMKKVQPIEEKAYVLRADFVKGDTSIRLLD